MQSREMKRLQKAKTEPENKKSSHFRFKHPILYLFTFVILIIIAVTFVGGPLLSGVGSNSKVIFGTWGGEEIEFVPGNYLSRQRDILYDQLLESRSNESYEWQAYSVWKGAYDRTVLHTAVMVTAERSGLHVSENRVDTTLLTSGPYMEDGEFSEAVYRDTSNAEKFRYRTLVRDDMVHQQYLIDLNHESMISTKAAEFLQNMAAEERSFRLVSYSYEDYPESELVAFAQDNNTLFSKIKLSRITVKSSEAEADTIRQQILDGVQTFEDQAKNYSTDGFSERGGEMGWREYNALQADFSDSADLDALFSRAAGELTEVFETSFGFVFYRIDEPAVEPDFEAEEYLRSVRNYMERFERGRIEDYLIQMANTFKALATDVDSFDEAANAQSATVLETEFFPINYGGSFFLQTPRLIGDGESTVLESATNNENFYTTLFTLDEDEISEPIILDESVAVFVLKESRTQSEEDINFLASYYPYIYQQFLDQDLSEYMFTSAEFEDNFINVFSEIFLTE